MNEPVTDRELLELAARKEEVTQWLDGKPPCIGVWRTRIDATDPDVSDNYQYWDGSHWGICQSCPPNAFDLRGIESNLQQVQWCGLATNPNAGGSDE